MGSQETFVIDSVETISVEGLSPSSLKVAYYVLGDGKTTDMWLILGVLSNIIWGLSWLVALVQIRFLHFLLLQLNLCGQTHSEKCNENLTGTNSFRRKYIPANWLKIL